VRDKSELARILHQQGFVLISVHKEGEEKKGGRFELSLPFFQGVSLTERMMFTRNIQVMISAGVPLPRSLGILAAQTKNRKFQKTLREILDEVTKGKSLSKSFGKYPGIFPELFVSMVRVGEEAGTLEEVFGNLTYQMEREHDLRSEIKGAMVYPTVIIAAMMGIGALMLIMVVPRLAATFAELGIDLPLTTQIVIAIGNFMVKSWFFLPLLILFPFFLLRIILRTKKGKKFFDWILLKIPVISPIIRKVNAAQTIRIMSSLIISGVPIVQTLGIISGAVGNVYFQEAMAAAKEKVRKGEKLSVALKPYENLYPLLVIQMIEVGEETGQTSDILAKLADFFEDEVTAATKNLSSLVEPMLMLLIGGAVGFFAISMIQPMYSILGAVQ